MSAVSAVRDRRTERREATRREILDAAWELVRADGLAALAMRNLGARVGMRAQSLYAYFPSKNAIVDAMFAESNRQLLDRIAALPPVTDPVARLRLLARSFVDFCVEDQVRYQLLYQRTIPRFVPSPESYAPAVEVLDGAREALRACGIHGDRALDAWTAVIAGVAAQQNSNQPGGDRWVRLLDDVIDMYLSHFGTPGAG
ncbi:MAG TPA: TetR/AcrR family transcriptional regulator [Micromonosporaceae bacterium]